MADIVRLKDRMTRRPGKAVNTRFEAQILMFTGVRYEMLSGWRNPADVVAGALIGGPLQVGTASHGAKDPQPC